MNRVLAILGIVIIVLLAGCTGVPSGSDDSTADDLIEETDDQDPVSSDDGDGESPATDDTTEDTHNETDEPDTPATVDGELELHHIDVGQADATLIITPAGETILIDTGDWRQSGDGVIEYLETEDIDRIDHLVATHGHADHIGGHDAIIEWAETEGNGIGAAYDSGVPHTSQTYDRYLDAVEDHDVELLIVEEGDELPIDGAVEALAVNPPAGDSGSDLHDNSLALVIEYGEFTYVTTGDAETAGETHMVDEWESDLDADVYQAGHHGSRTSSTEPFLDAVAPEMVVISSAYDSQYGHPHDDVLETFAERDVETYWTGVHGDVVVTTDGEGETTVATREAFSSDAADLLAEKPADEDDQYAMTPSEILPAPEAVGITA